MARELMMYAGQDKGNFELLDLSQLAEDMIGILKTSIPRHCSLTADLPRNLPVIWGNPTHIRQILLNLIINASEAIRADSGAIHISTSRVTNEGESELKNRSFPSTGDYLSLEVSDNGCGMTEEQQRRIFDPVFTTKRTGHGLGLAVVHGIVESHRGAINVTSTPGRGTTFEILLPCAPTQAEQTHQSH
jgi:signal transduction histidine kinase